MAEKWKKIRAKIIEWFSDVAELIKENKRISIIVGAFVLVVVAVICISSALAHKSSTATDVLPDALVNPDAYPIPEDLLEVDAYPEINDLMRKYYNAAASGDALTINSIRTGVDDKEIIIISKKSEYIQSYPVVTCYTKKGPIDDSFLVFAYYEVILNGYTEQIPGLNVWYVCKNENGTYYINEDPQDEKVSEYCKVISVQDDVVDLSNTVNVKFNEIINENEQLAAFMDELAVQMKVSVGEELAKAEAEVEEPEPTPEVQETPEPAEEDQVKTVRATTVVNVRASDSEAADKVGKAQEGQEFKLLEEKVNGWSKIEFDGKEAYIKSEFLEGLSTAQIAANDAPGDEEKAAASPSSGTATATDTINIREKASTSSDKLGVCYAGDKLEVINKQSDGWTKVKYNGKTGYVKSEFLE